MVHSRKTPAGLGLCLLMTARWTLHFPMKLAIGEPESAPSLPPNHILLSSQPELFRLVGQADAKIIPVQGPGFDRAWRVDVQSQPQAEFQLQLVSPVAEKLNPGDTVLLSVWARAPSSSGPDQRGCIGLILEQSADPFDKALARQFDLGSDWQRLDVAAKIRPAFGRVGAHVALRLGYFPQTVEIGGVELRRFDSSLPLAALPQTPLTYRGRESDAAWRSAADQRIESLRKSLLTLRITDGSGRPVSGADIQVRMVRHAFAFGSAYNDNRFHAGTIESSDDLAYQRHFTQLFNTGVDEAGMKWPGWEDPTSRRTTLRALQWMHDHVIDVRGHCLVWPGWRHLPPDLRALANDPAALERRVEDHIRDEAGALAAQVIEWDVVNEPYLNNDLMHVLGDDAMANWFKVARQADPSARLYLNETNVPNSRPGDHRYDALYNRVQALQQQGAPIGGIGMQAHFDDNLIPPVDLLTIYDRFATLGLPIRITELDINVADEQLQADYFRDFLTASFSHPEINGILLWGFWEDQHWRPDAALYRKDWSIKPNGQVWKDLVLGKWWTNVHGVSAADGTYSARGFLGDYEVTVTGGQRSRTVEISLPQGGRSLDISLE
jgi:GH35 family endo-1,4-beta-xylanase